MSERSPSPTRGGAPISSGNRSLSDAIKACTSGFQRELADGGALKKRLSAKASPTSDRQALSVWGFFVISSRSASIDGSGSNVLSDEP